MPAVIPVTALSVQSEELLARFQSGSIHSVYEKTVNLLCGDRFLVSLTASSVEVHPFSLCTGAKSLYGFSVGTQYSFREGRLSVGETRFLLSDAQRQDLSLCPPPGRFSLPGGMRTLFPMAEALAERSALGFLLFPDQPSPLAPWEADLIRFAKAVAGGDIALGTELGRSLFGMGWGLTPSTDDFCVGLLAAAQCVRKEGARGIDLSSLAEAAFGRTTLVSYNFLFHACQGRFTNTLLALARALFSGDLNTAETAAERLVSFGHSSGTDLLLGLLFGIKLLLEDGIHG